MEKREITNLFSILILIFRKVIVVYTQLRDLKPATFRSRLQFF